MRLRAIGSVLILLLIGAATASSSETAADFSLQNLEGKTVRLSSVYARGPVVLAFWATWCVPCPDELKHLQRFYEKFAADSLTVLAVSIDGPKTVSKVKPFVVGRRLTMPVLLDSNNDVKRLYRVSAVPTLYILERGGAIRYSHTGYRAGDEVNLEKELRKAIAADTSGASVVPAKESETGSGS